MTLSVDNASRTRRTTYIVLGIIFVLLAGTALVAFGSARTNATAEEKADQLIGALNAAGLRAPQKDQIVRVLGDDGGAVCADPNSALKRATLYGALTNGAAGPGTRPVIADNKLLTAQLIVITTYCPDQAAEFADFVNGLRSADLVKG
jgi:hypothetical protein